MKNLFDSIVSLPAPSTPFTRLPTSSRIGCVLLFLIAALASRGAELLPLNICLLSACAEYDSDTSLGGFQNYLESHYRIRTHRAFGQDKGDGLPGLDALDTSDLIIIFTRRIKLPPLQLEQIRKYIASGRPIIGVRTASHAFENYLEFDHDVLGGGYKGHYGDSQVEVQLVPGQT